MFAVLLMQNRVLKWKKKSEVIIQDLIWKINSDSINNLELAHHETFVLVKVK